MEAYPVEGKDLFGSDTAIGKEVLTYEERNVLRYVGGYNYVEGLEEEARAFCAHGEAQEGTGPLFDGFVIGGGGG